MRDWEIAQIVFMNFVNYLLEAEGKSEDNLDNIDSLG